MIKNQKGFTAVEGVMAVLLIIAIGAAGYFAYQARHSQPQPSASTTTSSKSQTDGPYSGWKTYSSKKSAISFQYPSNWSITEEDDQLSGEGSKIVTLAGPHGLELTYRDALNGVGGGCDESAPHVVVTNVKKLANYEGVYLVENPGTLALSDEIKQTGDQGSCLVYPTVGGSNGMSFATYVQFSPNSQSFSEKQKADLAEARLILLSTNPDVPIMNRTK